MLESTLTLWWSAAVAVVGAEQMARVMAREEAVAAELDQQSAFRFRARCPALIPDGLASAQVAQEARLAGATAQQAGNLGSTKPPIQRQAPPQTGPLQLVAQVARA
jgi:acetyl-CoA carboxylase carboxyltransferase component